MNLQPELATPEELAAIQWFIGEVVTDGLSVGLDAPPAADIESKPAFSTWKAKAIKTVGKAIMPLMASGLFYAGFAHLDQHNNDGSHKTVQMQAGGRRQEIGGQRADVRGQKKDHGPQTTDHESGRQGAEGDGQRSEIRDQAGAEKGTSNIHHSTPNVHAGARYVIRRGLGGWYLVYDGVESVLPDDKAVYYAAQLLLDPPTSPLHASVLDNLVFGHALVENQRNLGLDDQETLARQGQARQECLAVLADDSATAMERAEAQRDLDKINVWVRKYQRGTEASEQKQARAISVGLLRLIKDLERATGLKREPVPVLRAFGRHLRMHLWEASNRASGRRGRPGRSGCFSYEPPEGIKWVG